MSKIDLTTAIDDVTCAKYGFEWYTDEVGRGSGNDHRIITDKAQFIKVVNLSTFVEALGNEAVLGFLTGTSLKVRSDAVNRSVHEKNPKADIAERRRAIVARVLQGERAPGGGGTRTVTVTVFIGMDGKEYATKAAVQAANMAHLVDSGVAPELARAIVLQDAGQK